MRSYTKAISNLKVYTVLRRKFSKYFAKSHEWVSVDNGVATVGISDFAQNELGEIVHVELPKVGEKIKNGQPLGAVESVKTAADIYSPVDGVLAEVNEKLMKTPNLMNQDSENAGWYVKLKVDEAKTKIECENLMNVEQYEKFLRDSKH